MTLIIFASVGLWLYLVLSRREIINRELDIKRKINELNGSQPIKLRKIKDDFNKYYVQFYHPVYNGWWYIPTIRAGIHGKWSLYKKGSLGSYASLKQEYTSDSEANALYGKVCLLRKHFDAVNEKYENFKACTEHYAAKPYIVDIIDDNSNN